MTRACRRWLIAGLLLTSTLARAGDGRVTAAELRQIRVGQPVSTVTRLLGPPLETPRWSDGSHSRVYLLEQAGQLPERIYIDVDAHGRVVDVQKGEEGDA